MAIIRKLMKTDSGIYLGRSDDTMNIAGKRLGPADLESAIAAHPIVKESAAIGIPDEVKGEVPVIFVVPHEKVTDEETTRKELVDIISEKLGKAFLPKAILFVDSLPRTQSGKIARRLVRSAYLARSRRYLDLTKPRKYSTNSK